MAVDCDATSEGIQGVCVYESGDTFALQVQVLYAPREGYAGIQAKLRWEDGLLDFQPALASEEAPWQGCDVPAQTDNSVLPAPEWDSSLLFGCWPFEAPGVARFDSGAVLEFTFTCEQDGVASLQLVPRPLDPQRGTHFVDTALLAVQPDLAGAEVVCGPCPDSGCPPPPPLPSPPGEPASTQSSDPAGSGGIAVDCDPGQAGRQAECSLASADCCLIQVDITHSPADGHFGYQIKLRWADDLLEYLPADPHMELVSSGCGALDSTVRFDNQPHDPSMVFGCSRSLVPVGGLAGSGPTLYLRFRCQQPGTTVLTLVPRAGDVQGGAFFLAEDASPIDPELASATITCV
jgi:hypothetical protein